MFHRAELAATGRTKQQAESKFCQFADSRREGLSPDNKRMACFGCSSGTVRSSSFRSISAAMAKAASARMRNLGAGRVAADWPARARVCARCPMQVIHRGVAYCGTPFLRKISRDPVIDGCGCPINDKARSASEHCPVDARYRLPVLGQRCNCKWCAASLASRAD